MHFADRRDAGRRLGERLSGYRDEHPLVLALPRGGVPVGYEVARALGAPLDVLVVRKVGAPRQAELAIGAVGPGGIRVLNEDAMATLGIRTKEFDRLAAKQQKEVEQRSRRFRGDRPLPDLAGRTVVLVDNGIATGATMLAGVQVLRRLRPRKLVVAAPVVPPRILERFQQAADDVVVLDSPSEFIAVGQWYDDFTQTPDEEVERLLQMAQEQEASA